MHPLYRAVLRRDFASFIAKAFATVDPGTAFESNWHIDLIAEYLEAARRGECKRLIINMPPRSLKSICVSVAWPAWLLGHDPKARIIAASYAQSLSLKHSLDCRAVVQSPWYRECFPETRLMLGQNEKAKFHTTARGFRFATSTGGSLTGEGGNFLIIDDPTNAIQARQAHWRHFVQTWFDTAFASRLNDKRSGVIILVMQRLHAEDLSGYLLEKGHWEHLCLPAIAPAPHIYDFGRIKKMRAAGELLHPIRENEALIARAQAELGSHAFAAQYQQEPVAKSSAWLKHEWLLRYDQIPTENIRITQSWDTAIKAGDAHDASVCLTFGETGNTHMLLDAHTFRAEYPELKRTALALAERWKPTAMLIEDRASGQQLIQDLRAATPLPVIPCQPKGDKLTRFLAVTALIEAGKLLLPKHAPWLAEFESELLQFPEGLHDDQVDALTQYLQWVRGRSFDGLSIRRI